MNMTLWMMHLQGKLEQFASYYEEMHRRYPNDYPLEQPGQAWADAYEAWEGVNDAERHARGQ